jgi:CheY-like chemotaxis protein
MVTGEICGNVDEGNIGSASSPDKTSAGIPAKVKTVLVVDDAKFFREMITDILEPLHLNLLIATDGVEALDVIKKKSPDLVLLDLNLPNKNGFEVIREVRSSPELKDICLLAMSGVYHKEADAVEAKRVGANDFIKKSFKPEELQQFVKMWLIW